MNPEPESDLHWTAFLYVSGELTPEESSAFERRLDEDQDAREAVASAVELSGALALLGPDRSLKIPARRIWRWAIPLAAAACLAAAVLPFSRAPRPTSPAASEVAEAWSGLRANPVGESDAEWMARAAETPSIEAVEDEVPSERAIPSWLLSATSAVRDDDTQREEN
jgi:anti-sigma-K factor RskA